MIDIDLTCPHCQQDIAAGGDMAGQDVACPGCGGSIHIPGGEPPPVQAAPAAKKIVVHKHRNGATTVPHNPHSPVGTASRNQNVTVTDIQMGFWSMVVFMVKWALASIPALLILWLLGLSLFRVSLSALELSARQPVKSRHEASANRERGDLSSGVVRPSGSVSPGGAEVRKAPFITANVLWTLLEGREVRFVVREEQLGE